MHSHESKFGFAFHHIYFLTSAALSLTVELSFDILFFSFCCYVSYEIDCYTLLCMEIGRTDSIWKFDDQLRTLSQTHYRVIA